MKVISYFLLILSLLVGCQKEKINHQPLVNNTIEVFKSELPKKITFYREKNNLHITNTENYIFLDTQELLDKNDEKFYSLNILEQKDYISINILSYKSGKNLSCKYNKKGKLISKSVIKTKLEPSKPYYIYYEILKRKYPNYMNWKLFPIPEDSLK
ncbi:hypothetical protein J2810_000622 [Chryseobacterium rhizosphaerae]|uniref:hypothetical protein n=1 Tax=Chryseobacterium rhizosphaerae TaxID=395937 RepID=UPI0028573F4C|nr:hypothetical protein [Chryseobacterium rhizosphaerae]MDR6544582.1 hypothetical protein [Chryseobacterium rhizosphaerae]